MGKSFQIATLGCKVNQCDSNSLRRKLIALGLKSSKNNPDLVIINTCAVTKTAIKKSRRKFNELRKNHPKAKFVLAGCWPKIYPEDAEVLDADHIWGAGKQNELVKKIMAMDKDAVERANTRAGNKRGACLRELQPDVQIMPPQEGLRSRYFIKIQDGCEQFCSYCIIPYSRGKLSSRPEKDVLSEIKSAIDAGFREVVLCGIHLGLYGQEKDSKTCNLAQLLGQIIKIKNLGRVRLSSIEINDLSDELMEIIANSSKVCKHLHLPLQSGSDRILEKMNRPYDTSFYLNRITKARKLMPGIAITTDVIAGFPTERLADHGTTKNFLRKSRFSRLHVFPFSAHEKTPASRMKPVVEKSERQKRAGELRKIGAKLQKDFQNEWKGKPEIIAIERIGGASIIGMSEHYVRMEVGKNAIAGFCCEKNKKEPKIGALCKVKAGSSYNK